MEASWPHLPVRCCAPPSCRSPPPALLAGCATRFDAQGREIYVWQFGQDTSRDVDYSNPRLPVLPKWRPRRRLWPMPSPYEFNDLSRYSLLYEPAGSAGPDASASAIMRPVLPACNSTVRLALAGSSR